MASRAAVLDALGVAAVKALVTLAVWSTGFRAISDDDYARVVIAQEFARAPSFDPSGTSWLPLPFWIYGGAFATFGDSLAVARATALVLGVAAAVLVWCAAREFGLSAPMARFGGIAAAVLPYGAYLGAATVPEAPAAALMLYGVATLGQPSASRRALGGAALGAACLCRYDAWPVALCFAAITLADAVRSKRRELAPALLLALGPAALWMAHGALHHGDAWFFVSRVASYRAALGGAESPWWAAASRLPLALVRYEPELAVSCVAALALGLSSGALSPAPGLWRALLPFGALLAFLVAGDVSGGSATHHNERSLLPLWWLFTLITLSLLAAVAQQENRRRWLVLALALPAALVSAVFRPDVRSTFADRSEEEFVGETLRAARAERVVVDTDDYGYFAVQAALGAGRGSPLLRRDPRERETALNDTAALRRELDRRGADWLVTPRARAALAAPLGRTRAETPRLVVLELALRQQFRP